MEKTKLYFQSIGFHEVEIATITSYFKKKTFEKGDYFVKEGKISMQMGFLEVGQFQYYSTTEAGEERTTYISLPNTFVASLLTYLAEIPARENISALTNAILWIVDKKDVVELQNQIPRFKDFYIRLIEEQICCIDNSRLDFITLTAEQRYEKLLKENPALLQEVPLQYIASMLGITPRHLSRLRKNK
jgi:CRP-like cAMP-binding protein